MNSRLFEHPLTSIGILFACFVLRLLWDLFWYPEDYRMQEWWRPWLKRRGLLFKWMIVDYTKDC